MNETTEQMNEIIDELDGTGFFGQPSPSRASGSDPLTDLEAQNSDAERLTGDGGSESVENAEEPAENTEQDPQQAAEDPGEIQDLKALAEAIDVEPEFLYGLDVPMGGNQPPVKLGALKDRLTQAERTVRELQARLSQPQAQGPDYSQWSQEMTHAYGQMAALETQFQTINWQDPEADKGELAYLQQQLMLGMAQAKSRFEAASRKKVESQQQEVQQRMQQQQQQIMEMIPEWRDGQKANEDWSLMLQAVRDYGIPDNGILAALLSAGPEYVKMLRDFSRLKAGQRVAAGSPQGKTVRKIPKPIGRGGRPTGKMPNQSAVNRLEQLARTSPDPTVRNRAQIEAVRELTKGLI